MHVSIIFLTYFIISVCNSVLHFLGGITLWSMMTTEASSQQLLLLSLSINECLQSCTWVVFNIMKLCDISIFSHRPMQFVLNQAVGLLWILYIIMVCMTLDRLCAVLFGLRYPLYWDSRKTKILLIIIWCLGAVTVLFYDVLVSILGFAEFARLAYGKRYTYVRVVMSLLYTCLAVGTYVVLFCFYVKSRRAVRSSQRGNIVERVDEQQSVLKMFMDTKFYISLLIILTYILFSCVPLCIRSLFLPNRPDGGMLQNMHNLLLHLGFMSDAVIYIFLRKKVRKKFFRLVACRCWKHDDAAHELNTVQQSEM